MIGQLIHTYRIDRLLGVGGMGKVYLATDTLLDRQVALKMLQAELLTQPSFLDRFKSEAQILARLNHPNVAGLYNFVREEGDYFMVMEFVEGETLEHWLDRYGPLPYSLAVSIIMQATDGLFHAHKRNILHRDLKPANLMVTPDGVVKLTDFGIARIMGSQHLTQVNGLVGTPCYMAPEQILGKEPSPQSDIHALSVVLYELLSGRVPFAGESHYQTMERVTTFVLPDLRLTLPGLPAELDAVLQRGLRKDPAERYANVREFQKALAGIVPYESILNEEVVAQYQRPAIEPGQPIVISAVATSTDVPNAPPPANVVVPVEKPAGQPIVISRQPDPGLPDAVMPDAVVQPGVVLSNLTQMDRGDLAGTTATRQQTAPLVQPLAASRGIPITPATVAPRSMTPEFPEQLPNRLRTLRLVAIAFVVLFGLFWFVGRSMVDTGGKEIVLSDLPVTDMPVKKIPDNPNPAVSTQPQPSTPVATVSNVLVSTGSSAIKPTKNVAQDHTRLPANQPGRAESASTATASTQLEATRLTAPVGNESDAPDSRPSTNTYLPTSPAKNDAVANAKSRPDPAKSESAPVAESARPAVVSRNRRLSSGTEVVVALQEIITAATAKEGQSVTMRVAKAVSLNGDVVIPVGAEVQGDITGVDTGSKKEMLELRVRSIQADGQLIPVRGATFKYVGSKGEVVQFKSGQQFMVYTAQSLTF